MDERRRRSLPQRSTPSRLRRTKTSRSIGSATPDSYCIAVDTPPRTGRNSQRSSYREAASLVAACGESRQCTLVDPCQEQADIPRRQALIVEDLTKFPTSPDRTWIGPLAALLPARTADSQTVPSAAQPSRRSPSGKA